MNAKGSPEAVLIKGLKGLSLPHSEDQISAFMTYLAELKKWNRAYNLTSIKADEDIIIKHFLDSLLYIEALPKGRISVVDVGSGAGVPGIPIKIMKPEIRMYLAEPAKKKINFLRHVVKVLGLENIEVLEKRVEDIEGPAVDAVLTRALFAVTEFVEKASRLLKDDGMFILSKGPRINEELAAADKENLNYEVLTRKLPLTDIKRFLVMIKKNISTEAEGRQARTASHICINMECRMRKAGCKGFEGCPGFKARG